MSVVGQVASLQGCVVNDVTVSFGPLLKEINRIVQVGDFKDQILGKPAGQTSSFAFYLTLAVAPPTCRPAGGADRCAGPIGRTGLNHRFRTPCPGRPLVLARRPSSAFLQSSPRWLPGGQRRTPHPGVLCAPLWPGRSRPGRKDHRILRSGRSSRRRSTSSSGLVQLRVAARPPRRSHQRQPARLMDQGRAAPEIGPVHRHSEEEAHPRD